MTARKRDCPFAAVQKARQAKKKEKKSRCPSSKAGKAITPAEAVFALGKKGGFLTTQNNGTSLQPTRPGIGGRGPSPGKGEGLWARERASPPS